MFSIHPPDASLSNSLTEDLAQVKSSGIVLDQEREQIQAPFVQSHASLWQSQEIIDGRFRRE
jgi:hypothetical protein